MRSADYQAGKAFSVTSVRGMEFLGLKKTAPARRREPAWFVQRDPNAEPDYFVACTIVHEFLHPFGSDGNGDHYCTPQCMARTGMSQSDSFNHVLAQQSCGMCPDLFTRFRRNASLPSPRRTP